MKLSKIERTGGLILLIASGVLLVEASGPQYSVSAVDEGVNPGFIPKILLWIWVVLALALMFRPSRDAQATPIVVDWPKLLVFGGATVLYFLLVWLLGFIFASFIFLTLSPLAMGFRPLWINPVFGVVSTAALWAIFEKLFQLLLPTGVLFG